MMSANLSYNTLSIKHNGKVYCAYCGKEIEADLKIDGYDSYEYYHCNCEDAMKEIEVRKEIEAAEREVCKLTAKLPKPKFQLVTETTLRNICK